MSELPLIVLFCSWTSQSTNEPRLFTQACGRHNVLFVMIIITTGNSSCRTTQAPAVSDVISSTQHYWLITLHTFELHTSAL